LGQEANELIMIPSGFRNDDTTPLCHFFLYIDGMKIDSGKSTDKPAAPDLAIIRN
jgi:hypothetical protein